MNKDQFTRFIRRNRFLNLFPRLVLVSRYFYRRLFLALKWLINAREDTNLTYDVTDLNSKYAASTISFITGKSLTAIQGYLKEIQTNEDLKKHISRYTNESSYKFVSDDTILFGRRIFWYAFVRALKPRVVVETGVDKGLGSVVICAALLKNKSEGFTGEYFGTEIVPDYGFLLKDPYSKLGSILYGDSIASLKNFNKPIDLFINDSDHSSEYEFNEYMTIKNKMAPKGVILGDNSHGSDSLWKFSEKNKRNFLFLPEWPEAHWYPGAGVGISLPR